MNLQGQKTMWAEFERLFTQLSGLTLRVYDSEGKPLLQQEEPPLCSFLLRYRKSRAACEQDCFRQLRSLGGTREIAANRCHGGLSYRIVPVQVDGLKNVYVLVGKVLTEVSGSEETAMLARRYQLSSDELERHYLRVRFMSEGDLDRLAGFVRRFARHLLARRGGETVATPHSSLATIIDFGRRLLSFDGVDRKNADRTVGSLAGMLQAEGAALLAGPDGAVLSGLPASWRLDRESVSRLEALDWARYARDDTSEDVTVMDDESVRGIGLDALPGPMWIVRLRSGGYYVGRLVLFGGMETPGPLQEFALQILATRLLALSLERKKSLEEVELTMMERLGREVFVAPTLEEMLPLTLDTVMSSFGAHRGSILLAREDDCSVTDSAFRGAHAALSSTIARIEPGSVTHKVFTEARPFAMRQADAGLSGGAEREFPYRSRSFASVPLRENGTTLGVLHLTEREQTDDFTKDELSLLVRFGQQAAVAIQKARLKSEVSDLKVKVLTDWLTGAYNRRHLDAILPREVERASRFSYDLAVLFVDIDNFKDCNDTLGHIAGDEALKQLTAKISSSLRAIDSVFRYGGEEFVVILPETGVEGALKAAEGLRGRIEKEVFCRERDEDGYHLTVSIGVSVYPAAARSSKELLESANLALRKAKKLGKNRVVPPAPPATGRKEQSVRT